MGKILKLEYAIDNELFIISPLLHEDQFIAYCKDRGIPTSKEQLEQFEKLGIFYPIARVKYPRVKMKVEYSDNRTRCKDLGVLREDEEWHGDVEETYAGFYFNKDYAKPWLEEGLLWNPSTRPFQEWETFKDDNFEREIESFYSVFQCYPLYHLNNHLSITVRAGDWTGSTKDQAEEMGRSIAKWAEKIVAALQESGVRGEVAADICQIISNRYYPKTQSDRRTFLLPKPIEYRDWDWHEYCRQWNPETVRNSMGVTTEKLKSLYEVLVIDAQSVDPLAHWYDLVTFVSVYEKERLKGNALFAQSLYSMAKMISLFYEHLTGQKLRQPNEMMELWRARFYGKDVIENELAFLEFLTNQYHLNPRPTLILVVEGNGEEVIFPLLASELYGLSFPKMGIEVINLRGVDQFVGKKGENPYGTLERLIDYHHSKQSIVFLVLDRDNPRVKRVVSRLKNQTPCSIHSERKVTRSDYIHIWDKTIEFDNFSPAEIARTLTVLSDNRYAFTEDEVIACKPTDNREGAGDLLGKLYKEKLDYDLPKRKLLEMLCEHIRGCPRNEEGEKRPIVKVLDNIVGIASKNHRPTRYDTWKSNQESGYLGEPTKKE